MKMRRKGRRDGSSFLAVSLTSLLLFPVFVFVFPPPSTSSVIPWGRQLAGALFASVCLLGAAAGISPSRCSRLLHRERGRASSPQNGGTSGPGRREEVGVAIRGHHPDCGRYSSHTLTVGGRTLCAGCTGLVLGAAVAFPLCLLYTLSCLPAASVWGFYSFWLGFAGVALGLLQHQLYRVLGTGRGWGRVVVNMAFVLGALLLLVGVEELVASLPLDLYLLTSTLHWIVTRMILSRWEHVKVCSACGLTACPYYRAR